MTHCWNRFYLSNYVSMPLQCWSHAFYTTVYLINHLSTPILSMMSHFKKLFGHRHNLTKLWVFGWLYYMGLKPYTSHKLRSRSKPYVFIGYFSYPKCLPMLQLFYQKSLCILSCQIVENIFPFSGINLNLQRPTSSTLNS